MIPTIEEDYIKVAEALGRAIEKGYDPVSLKTLVSALTTNFSLLSEEGREEYRSKTEDLLRGVAIPGYCSEEEIKKLK